MQQPRKKYTYFEVSKVALPPPPQKKKKSWNASYGPASVQIPPQKNISSSKFIKQIIVVRLVLSILLSGVAGTKSNEWATISRSRSGPCRGWSSWKSRNDPQ